MSVEEPRPRRFLRTYVLARASAIRNRWLNEPEETDEHPQPGPTRDA